MNGQIDYAQHVTSRILRDCPSSIAAPVPQEEGIASSSLFFYTDCMGTGRKKQGVESTAWQDSAGRLLDPDDLIYDGRMRDGTPVILRSVCSRDQAALCAFFGACSPKSLYSRFERQIKELPIDLATQLCSADCKREIAVIAEMKDEKQQQIIGVGQLLADPDHTIAEYAVLVADPWQGRGLGSELTDFCLELAKCWGVKKVVGEFSPSNVRIIRILQSREFRLQRDLQEQIVSGEKTLG